MARQYTTATSGCLRQKFFADIPAFPWFVHSASFQRTNEYAGIAISKPGAAATGQRVNLKKRNAYHQGTAFGWSLPFPVLMLSIFWSKSPRLCRITGTERECLSGDQGGQGANINIAFARWNVKNPQKFTEFSIDTQNDGA
jgi:hypothetical protein